jgi:hypothetical protein
MVIGTPHGQRNAHRQRNAGTCSDALPFAMQQSELNGLSKSLLPDGLLRSGTRGFQ